MTILNYTPLFEETTVGLDVISTDAKPCTQGERNGEICDILKREDSSPPVGGSE